MDEPLDWYGGQKVRQIFCDIAVNIPEQFVTQYDVIAVDIFNNAIGSVITDGLPVEEAYEQARQEMLEQMRSD